ncbi:MAG: hypothetical protein OEV89_00760 [Desulfobulbaceae bacterium]|nr:hypothetical protein [Desulfobulbaceae bacterium]HIJ89373.1 hypothetical protein [Deltaproteobacteria bacterium]
MPSWQDSIFKLFLRNGFLERFITKLPRHSVLFRMLILYQEHYPRKLEKLAHPVGDCKQKTAERLGDGYAIGVATLLGRTRPFFSAEPV